MKLVMPCAAGGDALDYWEDWPETGTGHGGRRYFGSVAL